MLPLLDAPNVTSVLARMAATHSDDDAVLHIADLGALTQMDTDTGS